MSRTLIAVLASLATVLVLAGSIFFSYIDFQNNANQFENQIKTTYSNNQNVYDNGWKEVREKAQVPSAYTADLEKIYSQVIKGREGNAGELVRFIKEANPTLDAKLYVQIQESIEGFRGRFQASQTELLSQKQVYLNFLTATTSGRFFNQFSSYPHIDLTKFDIVTSAQTGEAFDSKKADEIKIR